MQKINLLFCSLMGNLCKLRVWFHLLLDIPPKRSPLLGKNLIVSLTSYGRRVTSSVPYAIFSILRQNISPEKVVLWLNCEDWNSDHIPFALQRMVKWKMLEVMYCRDIKSYKKLIPTLLAYPKKVIVTIDDDIYYPTYMLNHLYQYHLSHPDKILAYRCCLYEYKNNERHTFPIGESGVLYPPNSLHKIVFDGQLRQKLCPVLDDLWFYTMARLAGTKVALIPQKHLKLYYVDLFYQWTHKGSRLYDVVKKDNRTTLWELLCYFKLIKDY